MKVYATTDVGKVREINEDYFSVSYPEDKVQLFLLADGMGGYNGGEVASKLAITSARDYILDTILSNFNENASVIISTHLISDIEKIDSNVSPAIEAFRKRGFFVGFILTVWRILRCNPFCKGGYDPVPQKIGQEKNK